MRMQIKDDVQGCSKYFGYIKEYSYKPLEVYVKLRQMFFIILNLVYLVMRILLKVNTKSNRMRDILLEIINGRCFLKAT